MLHLLACSPPLGSRGRGRAKRDPSPIAQESVSISLASNFQKTCSSKLVLSGSLATQVYRPLAQRKS